MQIYAKLLIALCIPPGGNVENVRDKNKAAASNAVCEVMRLFLNELN